METKKFFFWGIFKSKKTIISFLDGVEPISFKKHTLGKVQGMIADFSNLSNDEFITVLGKLALIEHDYNLCICVLSFDRLEYAYIYVPSTTNHDFRRRCDYYFY